MAPPPWIVIKLGLVYRQEAGNRWFQNLKTNFGRQQLRSSLLRQLQYYQWTCGSALRAHFIVCFNYFKLFIANSNCRYSDCYKDISFSRTGRRVSTVISMMFAGAFCLIFSVSSVGFLKAGIWGGLCNNRCRVKLVATATYRFWN